MSQVQNVSPTPMKGDVKLLGLPAWGGGQKNWSISGQFKELPFHIPPHMQKIAHHRTGVAMKD